MMGCASGVEKIPELALYEMRTQQTSIRCSRIVMKSGLGSRRRSITVLYFPFLLGIQGVYFNLLKIEIGLLEENPFLSVEE